ncbi:MAG: hypothetical protein H7199_01710 [Burkholderiales bacterium]|nr:hypothetical protein [Flavobacterium sp.]
MLDIEDLEVEVEYQFETIGKYDIKFDGKYFILVGKKTNCLAQDLCNVTEEQQPVSSPTTDKTSCSPQSNCCSS